MSAPPRVSPVNRSRRAAAARLMALLGAAQLAPAGAQTAGGFPARPLKLVLGFPPGGTTDMSSRGVAEQLSRQLGQPVLVENRPGASGNIAADYVAKSAPDGYTLFYGTNTTHAMNVSLYPKLPFDPVRDFDPIMPFGRAWNVLVVNPSFPARTLAEFLDLARAKPDFYNVASPGNATSLHLSLELVKSMTGIQVVHIPYKGSAPALVDVLGGQVPVMMDNLPASLPYIRNGRLRALAITSPRRLSVIPDVPTFAEQGLAGFEVAGWSGIFAPAGTPRPVIELLNRELNKAIRQPALVALMADSGSELVGGTPEELAGQVARETARWRDVIRKAGVRLD